MVWVELVMLLALLQFLYFGAQAGRARVRYKVMAPAVTGHEVFERAYRVQMNTLELLIVYLPSMAVSARHLPPLWVAALGAVFLVGRAIYSHVYMTDPEKRSLGFGLSAFSTFGLLAMALVGVAKSLLA